MTEQELENALQVEYDRVIDDTLARLKKTKPLTRAKMHKILLEANKVYWIARLKKIDEYFLASTEEAARVLSVPYMNAAREFSKQVKDIYSGYTKVFELTNKEADRLLNTVKFDRTIAQNLQSIANKMPDGEAKQKILAEISAPAYRYRMQRAEIMAQNVAETCRNIAAGEAATERAVLQTQIEQAYSITVEGLKKDIPSDTIIREIEQAVKPVKQTKTPTVATGVQEFTKTDSSGVLLSFSQINERAVKQALNRNWSGKSFSSRIWSNTDKLAEEVKKVLIEGELKGSGVNDMAAEIMRRFSVGAYQARRLIRTEASYVTNQANLEAYRENGDERYEYMAIIDDKTSEICEDLDGEIFLVKDAKVGVNFPPMHPNCRSTTAPVVKTLEEIEDDIDNMIDSIGAPKGVDPLEWLADQLQKMADEGYRVTDPKLI
jgi:SPP1 gp7 family putative phage head morphogenesis protein